MRSEGITLRHLEPLSKPPFKILMDTKGPPPLFFNFPPALPFHPFSSMGQLPVPPVTLLPSCCRFDTVAFVYPLEDYEDEEQRPTDGQDTTSEDSDGSRKRETARNALRFVRCFLHCTEELHL